MEHGRGTTIARDRTDMTVYGNIGPDREEASGSSLIRELVDPSLKKVRARLAAHSLTDLRNFFFHGGPHPSRKTESRDPSERQG